MAKAKKTSSQTAKKSSNSATRLPAQPSPLIDAAAVDAARLLANRARLHAAVVAAAASPAPAAEQQKKESASFKQLKESIHHPAATAVSAAMGSAFGQQRSNLPLHGGNQVAHNQTVGSNVTRINVPRRTNG